MAGLYVPLKVGYADDDKIIAAGPMGELLYVRSLAFAKRTGRDGRIATNQLQSISQRIPNASRVACKLVAVGLWTPNGEGWYITGWLNHNVPAEELRATKSTAGTLGNHRRWHTGVGRDPDPECDLCRREGLV